MAQDFKKDGLEANPIQLWKYTRLHKKSFPPRILVWGSVNSVEQLARFNHNWEFVVAEDNPIFIDFSLPNLKVVWQEGLAQEKLYEMLASVDYLFCDKEDSALWLVGMLCGATPLFTIGEVENVVENTCIPNLIDRIENWEKAENLLTN